MRQYRLHVPDDLFDLTAYRSMARDEESYALAPRRGTDDHRDGGLPAPGR
jgi:hypothetical protein